MFSVPLNILRRALLALLLTMAVSPAPFLSEAWAQAPAAASPMDAAQIENLLTTLQDPVARDKFIEQLRGLVEAQRAVAPQQPTIPDRVASRFLESLSDQVASVGESLFQAAGVLGDLPRLWSWATQQFRSDASRDRLLEILGKLIVVMLAAWLAEYAVGRILIRPRRWIEALAAGANWMRLPYALLNTAIAALPVVVFAAVAFGVLTVMEPSRTARLVTLAFINGHLLTQAITIATGALLSPRLPGLRLAPLTDETAAYIYVWIRRIVALAVYGYFIAEAALLLGVPRGGHETILKLLGIAVVLMVIVLILQNRTTVSATIMGNTETDAPRRLGGLRRFLAAYWHIFAVLYMTVVLVIWLVNPADSFAFTARATGVTVAAVAIAQLLSHFVLRGIEALFRVTHEIRVRFPTLELRANRYLQIFNVIAVAIIYVFAAIVILQAWGVRSIAWFDTPVGQRVSTSAISIAAIVVVAVAVWELLTAAMERYIALAFGDASTRSSARFRTMITLAQRALLVVLAVFVGLMILSEIGINIAPLLAGAGVAGLAIGLGAQTLVKNLIEGVSNLIEDSFTVGDVVNIGGMGGVIEEITMRMVRLRDYNGHVHTIPFSEIKTVTNMTQDFAFAVFNIGVGYGEDVDRVIEVLNEEAKALRGDPELGKVIVADLEIAGVDSFGDNAVVIKSRFRVYPGIQQWNVMRAFNRRIKMAFDREDIEIPFPQRTVHVKTDAAAEKLPVSPVKPAADEK